MPGITRAMTGMAASLAAVAALAGCAISAGKEHSRKGATTASTGAAGAKQVDWSAALSADKAFAGVTTHVSRVLAEGDSIGIDLEVANSTTNDIRLHQNGLFLVDDRGRSYPFVAPPTDPDVTVPAGRRAMGTLRFRGPLSPRARTLRLDFNTVDAESRANPPLPAGPSGDIQFEVPNLPAPTAAAAAAFAAGGSAGSSQPGNAERSVRTNKRARTNTGMSVRITRVRTKGDAIQLDASMLNGRDQDVMLNKRGVWLSDYEDNGYRFVPPHDNPELRIGAHGRVAGTLSFVGPLDPQATAVRVDFNQQLSSDRPPSDVDDINSAFPTEPELEVPNIPVPRAPAGATTVAKLTSRPAASIPATTPSKLALTKPVGPSEIHARAILRSFNARRVGGSAVVTLPEHVLFDFDRATVKPSAAATLDKLAEAIRFYDDRGTIRVTGYTDSKGASTYNLDLSRRRADAVRAALVARGARANRLAAVGLGEAHPLAPNAIGGRDNPAGRRVNRRVEIAIPGA